METDRVIFRCIAKSTSRGSPPQTSQSKPYLLDPHLTFVALSCRSVGDLFPALLMNEIYESGNPSDIITTLQSSLAKKPKVNNFVLSFFLSFLKDFALSQGSTIIRSYLGPSYEKYFFDAPNLEPGDLSSDDPLRRPSNKETRVDLIEAEQEHPISHDFDMPPLKHGREAYIRFRP